MENSESCVFEGKLVIYELLKIKYLHIFKD